MAKINYSNVNIILNVEIPGRLEGAVSIKNGEPRKRTIAYHHTTMPSTFAAYASSDEGRIMGIAPSTWKNMSKKQRIEAHLTKIAEGQPFTYEIVEAD